MIILGNLLTGIGDKVAEPSHKPIVDRKPSAKSHRNQPVVGGAVEQKPSTKLKTNS